MTRADEIDAAVHVVLRDRGPIHPAHVRPVILVVLADIGIVPSHEEIWHACERLVAEGRAIRHDSTYAAT